MIIKTEAELKFFLCLQNPFLRYANEWLNNIERWLLKNIFRRTYFKLFRQNNKNYHIYFKVFYNSCVVWLRVFPEAMKVVYSDPCWKAMIHSRIQEAFMESLLWVRCCSRCVKVMEYEEGSSKFFYFSFYWVSMHTQCEITDLITVLKIKVANCVTRLTESTCGLYY